MNPNIIHQTLEEILALYQQFGQESYGENLSQLEHMVQSAQLAQAEGYEEEIVLAAFLHDIGHLYGHQIEAEKMGTLGTQSHEKIGANYLREKGFSETVASLVEGHVAAKRYLCYQDPQYLQNLSQASLLTLQEQGGPMNEAEAQAFEAHPLFGLSIKMRYWDEEAKKTNQAIPALDSFRKMMERHLRQQNPHTETEEA
jgi:phosphonate degradation associated HDIG domain protein